MTLFMKHALEESVDTLLSATTRESIVKEDWQVFMKGMAGKGVEHAPLRECLMFGKTLPYQVLIGDENV